MNPATSYGLWKGVAWIAGVAGAGLYAFVEQHSASTAQIVIIAVTIAAVPPTVAGIFNLIMQARSNKRQDEMNRKQDEANRKLTDVGSKVDGILSKSREDEKSAATRADHGEGVLEGIKLERERTK